MERRKPDPVRGALAGLAAGLVAAFAMNQFQKIWSAASSSDDSGGSDPATVKAANKVSRAARGRSIEKKNKDTAGEAVHYGLGAALGIAYGIAAEFQPGVTAGFGTAVGATTALILDNVAVPIAGLGDPPWETPIGVHAYGIVSHLVFGAVAEGTRAAIRAVA